MFTDLCLIFQELFSFFAMEDRRWFEYAVYELSQYTVKVNRSETLPDAPSNRREWSLLMCKTVWHVLVVLATCTLQY